MSVGKNREEARRWLVTAEEDLSAALVLLEKKKYSHCCFLCQQSGEKALKALFFNQGLDPWGHSLLKLFQTWTEGRECAPVDAGPLIESAVELDKLYIPTRYPNGLPDLTPGAIYISKDADAAVRAARMIIEYVKRIVQ